MAWLFAGGVEFDWEDFCVFLEVGVGGEDRTVSTQSNGTNQSVDYGYDNASAHTLIARLSGGFIIRRIDRHIGKRAKESAKFLELGWISNA